MFARPRHYPDASFLGYMLFAFFGAAVFHGFLIPDIDTQAATAVIDFLVLGMAGACVAAGIGLWRASNSTFGLGVGLGFLLASVIHAGRLGLLGVSPVSIEALKAPVTLPAYIAAATAFTFPNRTAGRFVVPVSLVIGLLAWGGTWAASTLLASRSPILTRTVLSFIDVLPLAVLCYVYFRRPSGVIGGVLVFSVFSVLISWPGGLSGLLEKFFYLMGYGAVPFGLAADGLAAMRQSHFSTEMSEDDSSKRDALTGLFNRRTLDTVGQTMFREALNFGRPVSILMMDLDRFKMVNDLHGHEAGDQVLQSFAKVLGERFRSSDLVARFGGEEFVAVLPGAPLAAALRLGERIRRDTEHVEVLTSKGTKLGVTVSIGAACAFPEDRRGFTELLARADKNLYRAKRSGRNRVMADAVTDTQDDS